jgi:Spy/CpxP family protein refolding chaperone
MRTNHITAGLVQFALALVITLPAGAQSSATPRSPQTAPSSAGPSQAPRDAVPQAVPQSQPAQATPSTPGPAESAPQAGPQKQADNPLDLTEEQKARLRPIVLEENQQMEALRNDASLNPEQKVAKANQIREAASPKIKAILTPEQLQKLSQMQQERTREQQRESQSAPANDSPKPKE